LVQAAIESVLRQEFKDFDFVIVDDASTDNSAEIIRQYSDRATVVLREQNGGEMAARNTAISVAQGEYICYLDSDDEWFPWTLETFAMAIERHERPALVGGSLFSFRDEGQVQGVQRAPYADSTANCYLEDDWYLGVMSAAIRRDVLDGVGGFHELRLNCMDSDLMLRIGDQKRFVRIESPFTLAFRQHAGILTNSELTFGGTMHLIESERAGKYPGGERLRADRLRHVTRRSRNATLQFLQQGHAKKALQMYWQTLDWNVRLGHWRYLAAVPLMLICPPLRRFLIQSRC
jgi:glycosyltransferase involved in cell wall biosynthesis